MAHLRLGQIKTGVRVVPRQEVNSFGPNVLSLARLFNQAVDTIWSAIRLFTSACRPLGASASDPNLNLDLETL